MLLLLLLLLFVAFVVVVAVLFLLLLLLLPFCVTELYKNAKVHTSPLNGYNVHCCCVAAVVGVVLVDLTISTRNFCIL